MDVPARGVTSASVTLKKALNFFNSRAREGRDQVYQFLWLTVAVSIHASTGDATAAVWYMQKQFASFNSRAHGRARPSGRFGDGW